MSYIDLRLNTQPNEVELRMQLAIARYIKARLYAEKNRKKTEQQINSGEIKA